jgi:hypothetical protein
MITKEVCRHKNLARGEVASYFGLMVEVVLRMGNYSLIRWRGRESIIDTQDLLIVAEQHAA